MVSGLRKKIMRRVYFYYVRSYTEQSMLYIGLVLGGSVALFGRWTHVSSLIDNLLAIPLGSVPSHVLDVFARAIFRGELSTVLVVLVMCILTSVSFWRLSRMGIVPAVR